MIRALLKRAVRRGVPQRYIVWGGDPATKSLALTFDDGPDPQHTPEILDVLRDVHLRATFFVVGAQVEKHPELVERMVSEGHELGNHTYSHVDLSRVSWRHGLEELRATERLLRAIDPRFRGIFRPPYGRLGLAGTANAVRRGRRAVMWTLDSLDHRLEGPRRLHERVETAPPEPGDILLFHDDNPDTATALPAILDMLRERSFSFETVSGLLQS